QIEATLPAFLCLLHSINDMAAKTKASISALRITNIRWSSGLGNEMFAQRSLGVHTMRSSKSATEHDFLTTSCVS
ncbi:UNVERIFIED_CONTAM: hypothetical protein NY603_23195, partial [Bacteroidetes bacterium 56_B9]